MDISSQELEQIVRSVLASMNVNAGSSSASTSADGSHGVFARMEDAIDAAYKAQRDWYMHYNLEKREKIIAAIRKVSLEHAEELAKRVHEETGMGRYEDKIIKHIEVINGTPGTECLTTDAISGDTGLMLEERGPFGVIGAITPSTNPTETIINNTISMIAGGNAVVFNVHPGAKKVCTYCVQLLHDTIVANGGPVNLITTTPEPTMDNVKIMTSSPKIRMMSGTGGMGLVNALLRSGKKTIGAGAGNPPVVVDATADIKLAAKEIFRGASFDNNLLCLAEKEVFAEESIARELVYNMVAEGAYLLSSDQVSRLLGIVFQNKDGKWSVNKKWVGKDAGLILEQIGVTDRRDCRLCICEVPHDHPFVLVEQLMPILPIVSCKTFEEACEYAYIAESGNRHTASMFSKNVDHMTYFGKLIETTIFTKNGATLKGVGIGGEGHCTMTIAGPTGEGLTNAKSFTRLRRCQLADGGLRIV
ncbi:MAG: aldehyde dehydrogenase EutE [Lachnospiraceae bacterium]|nr:aldehyde dehydrogenase EutE [Candidatus Equihabitans merdae]